MLLIDSENTDSDRYRSLIEAEERIINACASLNMPAARKMENRDIDLLLQIQFINFIGNCDYIACDVETRLKNYHM